MYLLVVRIRVWCVGDIGLCYSLIPHKESGKKCYKINVLLKGVIKNKQTENQQVINLFQ